MSILKKRFAKNLLVFQLLGSVLILTGVAFAFSFLLDQKPEDSKSAQAAPMVEADLGILPVNCASVRLSALTTTCKFDLQPGQTLPTGLTFGIGASTTTGGTCLANSNNVTCNNVPVGNLIGVHDVYSKIGAGSVINTNRKMYVAPSGNPYVKAQFTHSPDKGSGSPLFRSSDVVRVTVANLLTDTDVNPQANSYTCDIQMRSLQSPENTTNPWISLGNALPYNPTTGCSADITKVLRGGALNWSVRAVFTSLSDPTKVYTVNDAYIYRFEGAGIAVGS